MIAANLGRTAVCATCGSVYFTRFGCPNGHATMPRTASVPPLRAAAADPRDDGLIGRRIPPAPAPIAGGRDALSLLIGGAS